MEFAWTTAGRTSYGYPFYTTLRALRIRIKSPETIYAHTLSPG